MEDTCSSSKSVASLALVLAVLGSLRVVLHGLVLVVVYQSIRSFARYRSLPFSCSLGTFGHFFLVRLLGCQEHLIVSRKLAGLGSLSSLSCELQLACVYEGCILAQCS